MSLYKAVRPKKVSDLVFAQIRDLIYQGRLKPGEQLLPERDLARALEVSRPTVREAIHKLEEKGLVEHTRGKGTFVRSPRMDQSKNPLRAVIDEPDTTLVDLLEVRIGLECNASILAAQRATQDDLLLLGESLREMRGRIKAGKLAVEADVHFHMCIAYASKNQVQIHIMKSFYDLLHFGIRENLQRLFESSRSMETVLSQHEAILNALRLRDSRAAFDAMRRHIHFVIEFFSSGYLGDLERGTF